MDPNKKPLTPGRYIIQNGTIGTPFLSVEQDVKIGKQLPVVAGTQASIFDIDFWPEEDKPVKDLMYGEYSIKLNGDPVWISRGSGGKLVASPVPDDPSTLYENVGWNIHLHYGGRANYWTIVHPLKTFLQDTRLSANGDIDPFRFDQHAWHQYFTLVPIDSDDPRDPERVIVAKPAERFSFTSIAEPPRAKRTTAETNGNGHI